MVKKLDDMDFVIYRKYDGVVLTPKGEAIVYELNSKRKRRKVLSKTLRG